MIASGAMKGQRLRALKMLALQDAPKTVGELAGHDYRLHIMLLRRLPELRDMYRPPLAEALVPRECLVSRRSMQPWVITSSGRAAITEG